MTERTLCWLLIAAIVALVGYGASSCCVATRAHAQGVLCTVRVKSVLNSNNAIPLPNSFPNVLRAARCYAMDLQPTASNSWKCTSSGSSAKCNSTNSYFEIIACDGTNPQTTVNCALRTATAAGPQQTDFVSFTNDSARFESLNGKRIINCVYSENRISVRTCP